MRMFKLSTWAILTFLIMGCSLAFKDPFEREKALLSGTIHGVATVRAGNTVKLIYNPQAISSMGVVSLRYPSTLAKAFLSESIDVSSASSTIFRDDSESAEVQSIANLFNVSYQKNTNIVGKGSYGELCVRKTQDGIPIAVIQSFNIANAKVAGDTNTEYGGELPVPTQTKVFYKKEGGKTLIRREDYGDVDISVEYMQKLREKNIGGLTDDTLTPIDPKEYNNIGFYDPNYNNQDKKVGRFNANICFLGNENYNMIIFSDGTVATEFCEDPSDWETPTSYSTDDYKILRIDGTEEPLPDGGPVGVIKEVNFKTTTTPDIRLKVVYKYKELILGEEYATRNNDRFQIQFKALKNIYGHISSLTIDYIYCNGSGAPISKQENALCLGDVRFK